VRTTPYFADYFGFSQNPAKIKLQLRMLFNEIKIRRLEEDSELTDSGYRLS